MSSSKGKGGAGAARIGAIFIVSYLIGIIASPYILPIDFVSTKLQQLTTTTIAENNKNDESPKTKPTAPPTPTTPPVALPKPKANKKEKVQEADDESESSSPEPPKQKKKGAPVVTQLEPAYRSLVNFDEDKNDPFHGVDIVVHRNGEPDPCSRQVVLDEHSYINNVGSLSHTSEAILHAADKLESKKPLHAHNKYDFDAVLTHALMVGNTNNNDDPSLLNDRGSECFPTWDPSNHYVDKAPHLQGKTISDMIKFCDMGVDKTPIQLDHKQFIVIPEIGTLPCHYHTREGVRITSYEQLANLARDSKVPAGECTENERNADGTCGGDHENNNDNKEGRKELHLYAVQAGRVFIFAPKYVGETFELPHVKVPGNLPVWLEVISLSPRVFDVFNFFDRTESAAIVDKALKETSETHRIKRSSTGASGYNVNSQRTSENGFGKREFMFRV